MKQILCVYFLLLLSMSSFAGYFSGSKSLTSLHHDHAENCCDDCSYASAVFGTSDLGDFYTILPPLYPEVDDLSLNRNKGFTEGSMVLNSKGIGIGESGSYWVSFNATLFFDNSSEEKTVPVFVITNGEFDPSGAAPMLARTETVVPGVVTSIQGSGIMRHLPAGTTLSLVASNGGSSVFDAPITVISWDINIHRICR